MERNSIKQLLMSSNYFVLNKKLVKELGIETAFLLTSLSEADEMLADEDGWFYQTVPQIEEMTGLTKYKQSVCIEQLISLGILLQENKGMPMKRYFKIDYTKVLNILISSSQKTGHQDVEKLDSKELKNSTPCSQKIGHNKEHNINNINKELNNKERETEQPEETEKSKETLNPGMYFQEMRILLSGYNINFEKIARMGKPIERIKAVIKFAKENNKGEGWIVGAIRDDYKLETYKPMYSQNKAFCKPKTSSDYEYGEDEDTAKVYEILGLQGE